MRIAINGFGRIGKNFLRALLFDKNALKKISVTTVNIGPCNKELVAHLFKYDTLMSAYPGTVSFEDDYLIIDKIKIKIIAQPDPDKLDWKSDAIDWVVDCSGKFTHRFMAEKHLKAGAKKVLISAPAHDEDVSIIPGVNLEKFDGKTHKIVSLGSCTTNAFMPMLKVLRESCCLIKGFMTTVHAYTNSQALLDVDGKDARRSRAAALNLIPTTTGASIMVDKVIPELAGNIQASAIRIPLGKVSFLEITFLSDVTINAQKINAAFEKAAKTSLNNIVDITYEPLVSSDFDGNPFSVVIDAALTRTVGPLGQVFGWYDNEWAYSLRLKDFLLYVNS